jgi:acetyltransferase-like isoleucine patch superfamily enzyme
MLRYMLRAWKIGRRQLWAKCTTAYARLYFRAAGARVGRHFRSNGMPELELSLDGSLTIGDGFHLQNGRCYNMIGRQQRCYFVIGKKASLLIGDNVGISGSAIVCHQHIEIGDNTRIGMNCVIYDTDFHDLDHRKRISLPEDYSGVIRKPVIIGRNAFIGAHSTILKGVNIGESAIVGAGAVVTKDIPAGEIWGGNPARFIARNKFAEAKVTANVEVNTAPNVTANVEAN